MYILGGHFGATPATLKAQYTYADLAALWRDHMAHDPYWCEDEVS